MQLQDLVGQHILQGVDFGEGPDGGLTLDFCLDDVVYRCSEDPEDGYRSHMQELVAVPGGMVSNSFPGVAVVARYREEQGTGYNTESCDILELVDVITELVVLTIGTANTGDYYPCYVGVFYPQAMVCNALL